MSQREQNMRQTVLAAGYTVEKISGNSVWFLDSARRLHRADFSNNGRSVIWVYPYADLSVPQVHGAGRLYRNARV